jgi:predicted deacetylase
LVRKILSKKLEEVICMYVIRLDDASDYNNLSNWNRMEKILNSYSIKPIVGVIPNNQDSSMVKVYKKNNDFWKKVKQWQKSGWIIAMHGYDHVYITDDGGINPIQKRSEFAGVSLKKQEDKIKNGIEIFKSNGIIPDVFFAPSHTFDENTLLALKKNSDIRIISDTIANNIYFENDFYFLPQQSGRVRKLPFKFVTFCYHPNTMCDSDFNELENFIKENRNKFNGLDIKNLTKRNKNILDKFLSLLYFARRK